MRDALKEYVSLIPFLVVVFIAATTGSVFQPGTWYQALAKPAWTPPGWLFPIAWTILYIMIAIAGWLVWRAEGFGPALAIWAVGLIFNAMWSWIMFGEHEIGWALVDLVAMWSTIAAFIVLAWPLDSRAALLFVPYLAWASFAGVLNYEVWRMNPAT